MTRLTASLTLALLLAPWACNRAASLLPEGAALGGFGDVDKPETYTGATLYTYMDGGADFYVKQGFSTLSVRRYARGSNRLILELFEMRDADAATRVYASGRRPQSERELTPGCVASVMPAEVQVAKGRYYLLGRNEDPLAAEGVALTELARNTVARLAGECAAVR